MAKRIDIFGIWPTVRDMADATGDKANTVSKWKAKGRIPEDAWERVIAAAARAGRCITAQNIFDFNGPLKTRGAGAPNYRSADRAARRSV